MRLTKKNGIITIYFIIGWFIVRMERIIFAKCQQENDTSGKLIMKHFFLLYNLSYTEIFEDCSLSELIEFAEDTLLLPLLQLFADS